MQHKFLKLICKKYSQLYSRLEETTSSKHLSKNIFISGVENGLRKMRYVRYIQTYVIYVLCMRY